MSNVILLTLVPRGNSLFVAIQGKQTPFVDWANAHVEDLGVKFEVAATKGSPGNYNVTLASESWQGVENYCRIAALVRITDKLTEGGYSRLSEDGSQILNLSTSGPVREGGGRSARASLFINLANLSKNTTGAGHQVVENSADTRFANAVATYIERGGDIDSFLEKYGAASQLTQAGILEGKLKSMAPSTETSEVETEIEDPEEAPGM